MEHGKELAERLGIEHSDLEDIINKANEMLEKEGAKFNIELSEEMLFFVDGETETLSLIKDLEAVEEILRKALKKGE
jgi:predicted DNA binding protein